MSTAAIGGIILPLTRQNHNFAPGQNVILSENLSIMKRFRSIVWVMAALIAFLFLSPAWPAKATPIAQGISITITPTNLLPGQAGYVFVTGGHPLNVSITLDGQPMDVFWTGEGYLTPYAFHHDAPFGEHGLVVEATDPRTGQSLTQIATIAVQSFKYLDEELYMDSLDARLYDPVLNAEETARLEEIYAPRTQVNPWGRLPAGRVAPRIQPHHPRRRALRLGGLRQPVRHHGRGLRQVPAAARLRLGRHR